MTIRKLTTKAEGTRLNILETGQALVLQRGFSALGLQEILTAASVPKGSFYHYFSSKEAFGTALLQHYVGNYAEKLEALLEAPGTGQERLLRFLGAWISDPDTQEKPGWAETCLIVKLAAEVSDISEEMRLVLISGVDRLVMRIANLIAEGKADGSISQSEQTERLANMIYQMWLGSALMTKLSRDIGPMHDAMSATRRLLACPSGSAFSDT